MGIRIQRTLSLSKEDNDKLEKLLKTHQITIVDIFRAGMEVINLKPLDK